MNSSQTLKNRTHTRFTSSVSGEENGEVVILGRPLVNAIKDSSFARLVGSLLLGRDLKSEVTERFIDLVLKMLVDHGPYQSGAVNTIIASRAGKDLVSSLTSGLLTIGSRFGGAVNEAANIIFTGVNNRSKAPEIVENLARARRYVAGIGHRKYRLELPDPRVALITKIGLTLKKHPHLDLALGIEKVTTAKKPNLILNVDGAMAAVLLDLLTVEEKLTKDEIGRLIEIEFFNAFFVLSRSVGLTAHYLDQKRLNEPLFRLDPEEVFTVKEKKG